jgi:hypothetical protein
MGLLEVQAHALREHRALRRRLDEIDALAIAVTAGRSALFPFLCVAGLDLIEALDAQLFWRECHLLPVLHERFGPERAVRAARDLRAQRDLLRFEREELTDRANPPARIACGLRDLAMIAREDLAFSDVETS